MLILLADGPAGPEVLLIQRAEQLRKHAGQPAFPGGAADPEDGGPEDTALREAAEEVGLDRAGVRVVALLPELYVAPSGFAVTPVLAWWHAPHPVGVVDPAEVARVERVPVAELVDPANRCRVRHPSGYVGPAFTVRGMIVWGFTGAVLDRLLELAGWARPWDPDVSGSCRSGRWTCPPAGCRRATGRVRAGSGPGSGGRRPGGRRRAARRVLPVRRPTGGRVRSSGEDAGPFPGGSVSWLDALVLVLAVAFAVSGFRQGFLTAALSFLGFFGGAVLGAQVADPVASRFAADSSWRVAAAVAVVLAFALGGQVIAVWVGRELRSRLTWRPAQRVDAVLGALVSARGGAAGGLDGRHPAGRGAVPAAVRGGPGQPAGPGHRRGGAAPGAHALRLAARRGPRVRLPGGLRPAGADPGAGRAGAGPAAERPAPRSQRAEPSVLKITGVAGSCARRVEGSGFVYAPDRVMTNAHVVAGVTRPQVEVDGRAAGRRPWCSTTRPGTSPCCGCRGSGCGRCRFATAEADTGDDAIILGYPENGPFFVGPARVRDRLQIRGPDIYDDRTVTREVYSILGDVRSGNSGGPLLAPNGSVYGVIFAAAIDQQRTGFVLTAGEVADDARAGRTATEAVSTGDCA